MASQNSPEVIWDSEISDIPMEETQMPLPDGDSCLPPDGNISPENPKGLMPSADDHLLPQSSQKSPEAPNDSPDDPYPLNGPCVNDPCLSQDIPVYPVPPPDGGWGWLVVVGAGILTFLSGGLIRSFSLIFEQLRDRFGSSASAAAWVYSVNVTSTLFVGPVSTMLSSRFSVRKVSMVGTTIMMVGYLGSAYASNLTYMYLAHCVAGIGKGLIYTPTLVIIAEWFDKHRARATSLGLMMDGFGSLAMAPLLQLLFSHYGYPGTMLIVTALMANHFVTAALYRKPDKYDLKQTPNAKTVFSSCNVLMDLENMLPLRNDESFEVPGHERGYHPMNKIKSLSCSKPEIIRQHGKHFGESLKRRSISEPLHLNRENGRLDEIVSSHEVHREEVQFQTEKSISTKKTEGHSESKASNSITKYFDYRLLGMGTYMSFSLMMACASLSFSMCNTHIAGLAKERQLTMSQTSLLIAVMGGINTISKLFCGFLFDLACVRRCRTHLFSFIGLLISITLVTCPWLDDVIGFFIVWIVYMSSVSMFTTQESLILADLVGRDQFPSAIGINRFFRGIGVLVGPTVGGFLKDYTTVYSYTFVSGGLAVMTSVIIFEISIIVTQRRRFSK